MSGELTSKLLGYAMIAPQLTQTPVTKVLAYAMVSIYPPPRRRVKTGILAWPHR